MIITILTHVTAATFGFILCALLSANNRRECSGKCHIPVIRGDLPKKDDKKLQETLNKAEKIKGQIKR